jgi:hypothetical protein
MAHCQRPCISTIYGIFDLHIIRRHWSGEIDILLFMLSHK